jgi:L-ribulose-5-phosphate 4-epimerase
VSVTALRRSVLAANRALVEAGLVVLTFGNVSGVDRDAGVMAIKPSGVAYDDLDEEAIVVVDLASGAPVEGGRRPSSDTPTHLVLYRHYESIGGIVHTHSPFATAWAQARRPIPCLGTTHADHFRGPVPVTRSLGADEVVGPDYEARTGDVIAETLDEFALDPLETPAVLVASHGPFAWGADADEAVENAVALEVVAAAAYRATRIAPDAAEIDDTLRDRHFLRKHGPTAYYGQR